MLAPGRAAAGLLLALSLLLLGAAPSGAQDGGPYGSTTTTEGGGGTPSCQLRTKAAAPGETVTVHLKAIARGDEVEIRLDGEPLAQATATKSGSSPRVSFDVDFVVPTDTQPGTHSVAAVGADFNASCQTGSGEDLEVAAGAVRSGEKERGGGSLARTGMYLALLVAVALGLLVVGRAVLAESRRRARSVTIDVHPRTPRSPRR